MAGDCGRVISWETGEGMGRWREAVGGADGGRHGEGRSRWREPGGGEGNMAVDSGKGRGKWRETVGGDSGVARILRGYRIFW